MIKFPFSPFPELTTERLVLKRLHRKHEADIWSLRSNEQVWQYVDRPLAQSLDDARAFIKMINRGIRDREWVFWGISMKGDTRVLGTICLWNISLKQKTAEIGYEMHPDFWGKGIMSEAAEAVIDYGFTRMKLRGIEAYLDARNDASARLLQNRGFAYVRTIPAEEKEDHEMATDMAAYSLIR